MDRDGYAAAVSRYGDGDVAAIPTMEQAQGASPMHCQRARRTTVRFGQSNRLLRLRKHAHRTEPHSRHDQRARRAKARQPEQTHDADGRCALLPSA
jgi:hypothetical protein